MMVVSCILVELRASHWLLFADRDICFLFINLVEGHFHHRCNVRCVYLLANVSLQGSGLLKGPSVLLFRILALYQFYCGLSDLGGCGNHLIWRIV